MNEKQWFVLAWSCLILGFMFLGLDHAHTEIYEPFIYLSYALWIVFIILGFMERKIAKNKK